MRYLDTLTTSQQALVLGRTIDEQIELIEHALRLDRAEARTLDAQIKTLNAAGLTANDQLGRLAAINRSIQQTKVTLANIREKQLSEKIEELAAQSSRMYAQGKNTDEIEKQLDAATAEFEELTSKTA